MNSADQATQYRFTVRYQYADYSGRDYLERRNGRPRSRL